MLLWRTCFCHSDFWVLPGEFCDELFLHGLVCWFIQKIMSSFNLITKVWPRWILPAQSGNGALPVTACPRCPGCGLCLRASSGELCWLLSLPAVESDEGVVQKELDFLLSEPGWSKKSLRWARLDLWIEQEENMTHMSVTTGDRNWRSTWDYFGSC